MRSAIIKRTIIFNLAMILFIGLVQIQAQTNETIKINSAETQKESVEKIVKNYILTNPEIIREAMKALQIKEEREKRERTANNLKRLKTEIFADPNSPTAGKKDADVSIVAFFDYNCGYCKRSLPALKELLAKDPSLKVIYKEFPILNPDSHLAAKAALAAHRQGKYVEFHDALVNVPEINEGSIKSIAEQIGLNFETLEKDMNDEKINTYLASNYKLAADLNIQGTPAYIVGTQLIPGAVSSEVLANIVAAEREKLTKSKDLSENVSAQ